MPRPALGLVLGLAFGSGAAFPHPGTPAASPEDGSGTGVRAPERLPEPAVDAPAAAVEEQELRREQLGAAQDLEREFPGADAAFALAITANEQGDLTSAIRHWEDGLRQPRSSARLLDRAEMLTELGEALKLQEQYDRAELAFREALELQPRREATCVRYGQFLLARDRAGECLAVLDRGQVKSPAAFSLRGQAGQRLGRFDEARRHYERALQLDPKSVEACYGLSVVCTRLGDAAGAAGYRERFARLKAERQAFGREFRTSLNPLRTTQQSLAMTHTTVGWIYQDRGQPAKAESLWLRAAALDPANTACRFHLLMRYQQTGRNADALRVCEEMVRVEPANPFHRISLGNLESRRGRLAEATAAFETAHRLAPDRPETCFALAQALLRSGTDLPRAASLAARAVELSPVAPHQYILSRAALRAGDRPTAAAAARRACELDPRNADYQAWRRTLEAAPPPGVP